MSLPTAAKPGVWETGRAMMQSPTAATVKPSATLIVSSRWGSRGAGVGDCCAMMTALGEHERESDQWSASHGASSAEKDVAIVAEN